MVAFNAINFAAGVALPRNFFTGQGNMEVMVVYDKYTMAGTEAADDTVVFGVVPEGYEVFAIALRFGIVAATTATLDIGLYERLSVGGTLGDVVDKDGFVDGVDASAADYVTDMTGVGIPAQSTDSLIVVEFETLTGAAGVVDIDLRCWAHVVDLGSTV